MKIAVIGYGSIGRRHADNIVALGHTVSIYDPLHEAGYPNVGSAMRDADGVVIASPTDCHLAHLRLAIQLGKPVLCEKPIGDIGHAKMVRKTLSKAKAPVMMGNMLRMHPCVRMAKEWLVGAAFGKPLWAAFTAAQKNTKYREPVVLNWGSHECDLALYLLGPAKVAACIADQQVADVVLEHEGGWRSSIHLDYITPSSYRGFHIHGGEGWVAVDLEARRATASIGDSLGTDRSEEGKGWDGDYVEEMRAFLDMIEGKPWPNAATGADGLATLELIEAAWLGNVQ